MFTEEETERREQDLNQKERQEEGVDREAKDLTTAEPGAQSRQEQGDQDQDHTRDLEEAIAIPTKQKDLAQEGVKVEDHPITRVEEAEQEADQSSLQALQEEIQW